MINCLICNNPTKNKKVCSIPCRTIYQTGENNPFFGRKHSTETLNKISDTKINTYTNRARTFELSIDNISIINGFMLGDFHIETISPYTARISSSFKYKEICDLAKSHLPVEYQKDGFSYSRGKQYFNIKTLGYSNFLDIRNLWYVDSFKRIPKNLILDQKSCYWWYIGDGHRRESGVQLSTDGFLLEDVDMLVQKLSYLGFQCNRHANNRIYMREKSVKQFLNWISVLEIPKCYEYKFIGI